MRVALSATTLISGMHSSIALIKKDLVTGERIHLGTEPHCFMDANCRLV
jgi:hypothetical protein